jgi:hypothetical protein
MLPMQADSDKMDTTSALDVSALCPKSLTFEIKPIASRSGQLFVQPSETAHCSLFLSPKLPHSVGCGDAGESAEPTPEADLVRINIAFHRHSGCFSMFKDA